MLSLAITPDDTFKDNSAQFQMAAPQLPPDLEIPDQSKLASTTQINSVVTSLSALIGQLNRVEPSQVDIEKLSQLWNIINNFARDRFCVNLNTSLLPLKKKVAPSQHTWTETAKVMGVCVKSKRKSEHKDPYSGGERSGKKARPDVLQPLLTKTPAVAKHQVTTHTSVPIPASSASLSAPQSNPISTPSMLPTPPIPQTFIIPYTSFNGAQAPEPQFNPRTFNLRDTRAFMYLKRADLTALCRLCNVSAGGGNDAMIKRLQAVVGENTLNGT